MMAARALGMRPAVAYWTVIWPQARCIAAPAALGVFVGAVKDLSLIHISSFHLILHGRCHVDLGPGQAPLTLAAGDGVFFLRDLPHTLTPLDAPAPAAPVCRDMRPLLPRQADGTGLACGFFQFRPGLADLVAETLPDVLVLRADDARYASARGA